MIKSLDSSQNQSFTTKFLRDLYLGSASGMSAVVFIKPQIYFKNLAQTSTQLTMNPFVWFRGTGVFTASFVPIIATQNIANSFFLSTFHPLLAASAAGATSAIISCPSEGVLIQQEKTGKNILQTISYMHTERGFRAFQRGLVSTMARDSIFAGAYLGAVPIAREELKNRGFSKAKAQLCAGIGSGIIAAIISQPFDTYKTQIQSNLSRKVSILGIFQRGAYLGLPARISMVATATTIIPIVKEKLA